MESYKELMNELQHLRAQAEQAKLAEEAEVPVLFASRSSSMVCSLGPWLRAGAKTKSWYRPREVQRPVDRSDMGGAWPSAELAGRPRSFEL